MRIISYMFMAFSMLIVGGFLFYLGYAADKSSNCLEQKGIVYCNGEEYFRRNTDMIYPLPFYCRNNMTGEVTIHAFTEKDMGECRK
jgi:hypothetical protein